jgi:hypothetical protein
MPFVATHCALCGQCTTSTNIDFFRRSCHKGCGGKMVTEIICEEVVLTQPEQLVIPDEVTVQRAVEYLESLCGQLDRTEAAIIFLAFRNRWPDHAWPKPYLGEILCSRAWVYRDTLVVVQDVSHRNGARRSGCEYAAEQGRPRGIDKAICSGSMMTIRFQCPLHWRCRVTIGNDAITRCREIPDNPDNAPLKSYRDRPHATQLYICAQLPWTPVQKISAMDLPGVRMLMMCKRRLLVGGFDVPNEMFHAILGYVLPHTNGRKILQQETKAPAIPPEGDVRCYSESPDGTLTRALPTRETRRWLNLK